MTACTYRPRCWQALGTSTVYHHRVNSGLSTEYHLLGPDVRDCTQILASGHGLRQAMVWLALVNFQAIARFRTGDASPLSWLLNVWSICTWQK